MPTYEFECAECGERFELFLPMSADAEQPCPACGQPAHRLIGAGAAVLMHGSRGKTSSGATPYCGRSQTCCGREGRCDSPPCGE